MVGSVDSVSHNLRGPIKPSSNLSVAPSIEILQAELIASLGISLK